jgi:hypothetical protein
MAAFLLCVVVQQRPSFQTGIAHGHDITLTSWQALR